jgi:HEAT repeat protein
VYLYQDVQDNIYAMIRALFVAVGLLSAEPMMSAQQPKIVHAQLTIQFGDQGLNPVLHSQRRQSAPQWIGYSIPILNRISSGWSKNEPIYLEGDRDSSRHVEESSKQTFDHAAVLLRVIDGSISSLRIEDPDRELDAGGTAFTWVNNVNPEDSVKFLAELADQSQSRKVRDCAVFAISLHQTASATNALAEMTSPSNKEDLREKAAFWLVNQRGHDGLIVVERLAHDDNEARFREKLTFDLTLSEGPAALDDLIRMAHMDPSPQVRRQAQFWMANKGGRKVTDDLRQAIANDPEESVRKSAVFALSPLPDGEATSQLITVADTSKDSSVRRQAIFWLGQSNDPKALDYLTKLLKQ